MMTYDQFLTWAAEQCYNDWVNGYEFNGIELPWGENRPGVVSTAAIVYNRPEDTVTTSIRTRLVAMYGTYA